jgi:hypothetical protein
VFDCSPKWIHSHTICTGIEFSSKNGFEKQFIYFDSVLPIFVGYRLRIMGFFQSHWKNKICLIPHINGSTYTL